MKGNHSKLILAYLLALLVQNKANGQNIRGDSIHLGANSVVTVFFRSAPSKAVLNIADGQEPLYKVMIMGQKSLSILALKNGAKGQDLEVTEDDRKHVFILSYKEGSPARSIDLSSKKTLSKRSDETKKAVAKQLEEANKLFDQAKNNRSDQALWEKVELKYLGIARFLDPKEAEFVKSRLAEIRKQVEITASDKKFSDAMKEGQNYYFAKKYDSAKKTYQTALKYKPGNLQALKAIALTDSTWAKGYIDEGDKALKAKNYVLAKENYQNALQLKPDYPSLMDKFNQSKKFADPIIYELEKQSGDEAMKANDLPDARQAYDSALSVKPEDEYVKAQFKKLAVKEQKVLAEEAEEAEYQRILASAKNLADSANTQPEYDLAIKEYSRALAMMPTRKFPKKKVKELTTIKKSLRTN